ncbi:MAG: S41 family peptidase [Pseudomonadales bacterium]
MRPLTLFGIMISMVTGIALGIIGFRAWLNEGLPHDAHGRAFEEVLRHVHANYVDEVDKQALVNSALNGMLKQLDDHSLFLDTRDYRDLQAETSGHFGGIGIEVGLEDDLFTVIAPIDDTPAARAGLVAGDRIIAIDQQPLKGQKLVDVVNQLRGVPGTPVSLRLQRDGAVREVDLVRQVVAVKSVKARLLEPGYGYVRISVFQMNTGQAFEAALKQLRRDSGGQLDGLVLDLRDNPGGVLQASVAVTDALLDAGLIVYTDGRLASSKLRYRAARGDLLDAAPIVVLINEGSASAAEIVAGALQDHGRATVMGSRSYGKGSVQSVVPVTGNQAIKLTTAYYYTPSGRSIHRSGIIPDLPLPREQETREAFDARLLDDAVALLKQRSADRLHARLL